MWSKIRHFWGVYLMAPLFHLEKKHVTSHTGFKKVLFLFPSARKRERTYNLGSPRKAFYFSPLHVSGREQRHQASHEMNRKDGGRLVSLYSRDAASSQSSCRAAVGRLASTLCVRQHCRISSSSTNTTRTLSTDFVLHYKNKISYSVFNIHMTKEQFVI